MKKHPASGFTLVEVLITIAILAVIATVTLIGINPLAQLSKSQDAKRKSDLNQIQKALELYYQDNGKYPNMTTTNPRKIKVGVSIINWGSAWLPYMAQLPKDPNANKNYVYFVDPTNQMYWLYANLDRGGNDPGACNNGAACPSATTNSVATTCGGTCNYGVSSSNTTP